MLDGYPVKTRLHDIADQAIILEESCIFNLKLVIEVANVSLESVLHTSECILTSRANDRLARMGLSSVWLLEVLKVKCMDFFC